jgi:hypothetical protein
MTSDEPLFRLALGIRKVGPLLMATGALLFSTSPSFPPKFSTRGGAPKAKLKHLSAWSCRYRQPIWPQASNCFCSSRPIGTLVRELANSSEEQHTLPTAQNSIVVTSFAMLHIGLPAQCRTKLSLHCHPHCCANAMIITFSCSATSRNSSSACYTHSSSYCVQV